MAEPITPTQANSPDQLHSLIEGSIVGGKYKILHQIGKGGMGSVYRVQHIFLQTEFALKTMDGSHLSDIMVRRFQQEAKAAVGHQIWRIQRPGCIE